MFKKQFLFLGALFFILGVFANFDFSQAAVNHPRILLNNDGVKSLLEQKVKNNDSSWTKLKELCDKYVVGKVEYPDGTDYVVVGNIGEKYQGEGYIDPILNLGVCYNAVKNTDSALADKYAKKGIEVIMKMSAPPGDAHYQDPLRNSGYAIRFFGVGMALGYDWFWDKMSAAEKKQVYTSLNHWIEKFESAGFGRQHPQGNYFSGYYAAKALTALATEDENPKAEELWSSWLSKQHYGFVQPYYEKWMRGGGWPEGWNYGPVGTINMLWPTIGAYTAKNMDLVRDSKSFSFPFEQQLNLIHFTWPNRKTLDDRGALYQGDNPTKSEPNVYAFVGGVGALLKNPNNKVFQNFTKEVRSLNGSAPEWMEILFWNQNADEEKYSALPLTYVASGMNQLATRSSWDTNAVWASFSSGPYINYSGSGEQFYDQGGLAIVKGSTPVLINAVGGLLRNRPGFKDEKNFGNDIYGELYDRKNRTLFNVFYIAKGQIANGPKLNNLDNAPRTRLTKVEDRGVYTAFKGEHIENMYSKTPGEFPKNIINAWDREIVNVRPDVFVVYDYTNVADTSLDNYQGFHLTYKPEEVLPAQNGIHTFKIVQNGNYVGSVKTIYPENNKVELENVWSSDKVYRLEVRGETGAKENNWLTVFDVANSPDAVKTEKLKITGKAVGVSVKNSNNNYAVLFNTPQNTTDFQPLSYTVSNGKTIHVVSGLTAQNYEVKIDQNGVVTIQKGTGIEVTNTGRLYFMTENGKVTMNPTEAVVTMPAPTTPPPAEDPGVISDPPTQSTPLYRLWNKKLAVEYYTASITERNQLLKNKTTWQDKGVLAKVISLANCNNETMYKIRLFSSKVGGRYIYTKNEAEKKFLKTNPEMQRWVDKGDVFCAYKDGSFGAAPFYRLRSTRNSQYIYKKQGEETTASSWYKKENTAFYALPN